MTGSSNERYHAELHERKKNTSGEIAMAYAIIKKTFKFKIFFLFRTLAHTDGIRRF
jgi:hypothetical protein